MHCNNVFLWFAFYVHSEFKKTNTIILNSDIFNRFIMCSLSILYVACQYCVCVCVWMCKAHVCVCVCVCVRELMWFLNDNCSHIWLPKPLKGMAVCRSYQAASTLCDIETVWYCITLCTVIMVFVICFYVQNVITPNGMSKISLSSENKILRHFPTIWK